MSLWNSATAQIFGPQIGARLAAAASATIRGNLRTALEDGAYLFKITPGETAAGLTDADLTFGHLPGSFGRYGIATGVADNGPLFNKALAANPLVFDDNMSGPAIYPVQTTIRYQAAGQIIRGAGFGDANTAAGSGNAFAPRTTLQWTGASGGTVLSFSDGTVNYSETVLEDLCIDGNALASKGVAYDDTLATGCWRNVLNRVAILNCTQGVNPSAVYLGNNAAGFGNDTSLHDCYLGACGNGVYGTGSVSQLFHCTVANMTVAGLHLPGNGAEAKCYGGVFHTNAIDILCGDAGQPIQNVAAHGTWFENSSAGIVDMHDSFSLQLIGCHLHTSYATYMMNFRGQAGHAVIKSFAANPNGSYVIANTNPDYDYDLVGTGITLDTGFKARVVGLVGTDNAKFLATLTATSAAATGDGTLYAAFSGGVTKEYDLAAALSAAGVFTAPVTGYYHFRVMLGLTGVLATHDDAQLLCTVAGTSAGTYYVARMNPGAQLLAGGTEAVISGTVTVPMTKGDTATINLSVSGSTKVVEIEDGLPAHNYRTMFEGRLV